MSHQTEWEKDLIKIDPIFESNGLHPKRLEKLKSFIATLIAEERERIVKILKSLDWGHGFSSKQLDEALLAINVQDNGTSN